ncbi:O-antigen ligase family protein [Pseudoalteromonas sp. NZS71]|uniref:O-antigen ligase family protein n=1 Tax=Pseudoalteromonas sp. NZS71 TaxID=2792052 RepID=UPI0018CE4E1B|nr:O-antigen ligase family protein [Pseudoalteromonas sp. NZS71]MBH0060033.1 O-antigen ligase family protein [Pseudoalteromonas sp. NZS71]
MRRINALAVLTFLPLILDQFQGFIIIELGFSFPISVVIKMTLILYMINFIYSVNRMVLGLFLIFLFLPLFLSILVAFFRDYSYTFENFIFVTKVIYFPLVFLFFKNYFKVKQYDFSVVINYLCYLYFIFFLFIALSIIGLGESLYGVNSEGVSIGYSGYFVAGNELGPIFIILSSVVLFFLLEKKKSLFLLLLLSVFNFVFAFLIGTKAALLGSIAVTVVLPFYLYLKKACRSNYSLKSYVVFVLSISLMSISIFSLLFHNVISAYVARWEFFYSQADSLISFLLSGRLERVEAAMFIFLEDYSFFEQLFGGGFVYFQTKMSPEYPRLIVEIDLLDSLLTFGIVGTVLVYSFWFYIAFSLFFRKVNNDTRFLIFVRFIFVVILSLSFISGHIIYSSLLGFYLALISSLSLAHNNRMGSCI